MSSPYRIRPAETWVQARADYLAGMSAEEVCRRHDLGLSAFRRRARRHGWRRQDQDVPPDPADLTIYDDLVADDEVRAARRRYLHALEQGRSVEAARWRRLWRELKAEVEAFDAEFFRGMTPTEIASVMPEDDDDDEIDDALALLDPPSDAPDADAEPDLEPEPASDAPPRNVHDVHPVFSSAHSGADPEAPPPDRHPTGGGATPGGRGSGAGPPGSPGSWRM
jgi:transposase